jgi:hypothetical protein
MSRVAEQWYFILVLTLVLNAGVDLAYLPRADHGWFKILAMVKTRTLGHNVATLRSFPSPAQADFFATSEK